MRIEAYAIISEDGMIADPAGRMPAVLTVEADQKFFHEGLDCASVVVHGRRGGVPGDGRKAKIPGGQTHMRFNGQTQTENHVCHVAQFAQIHQLQG